MILFQSHSSTELNTLDVKLVLRSDLGVRWWWMGYSLGKMPKKKNSNLKCKAGSCEDKHVYHVISLQDGKTETKLSRKCLIAATFQN